MAISDVGAYFSTLWAALWKADADFKANKLRPAAQAMTGAQAADAARKVQAWIALAIPILDSHPGALTAADDIAEVAETHGVTWAVDIATAIDAAPAVGAVLAKAVPAIIWALGAIEPAATGIQGDRPTDGAFRVGRG